MFYKKKIIIFSALIYNSLVAQNFTADFIKSVSLSAASSENLNPILKLGETIHLSFDDLEADSKNYYYKIEHCDYNWTPTNINTSEYINGFDEFEIQNFENSFNTLQNYTHYHFQIPNENTKIIRSGNYLISVFNSNNEICIQRRFVIYESLSIILAKIVRDRHLKYIDKKQVIQFSLLHPDLKINNPSKEISIYILQNSDWNFVKKDLKPQFFKKNEIIYRYNNETSFYAGNEFLNFDSKDITGSNLNIESISLEKKLYHSYLYKNIPRANSSYTYYPDINGGFVIRTLNGADNSTESDYTWVHFSLEANSKIESENCYIYGAFNNYETNEENLLVYNPVNRLLETKILLKQGFYNYIYATKNNLGHIEKHNVGGTFYETENKYTILAYYKPFGFRIGKIIGMTTIFANSR